VTRVQFPDAEFFFFEALVSGQKFQKMAKRLPDYSIDSKSNKKGNVDDTSWVIESIFEKTMISKWFSVGKVNNDKQGVLKTYAQEAGFRASLVSNPRAGVSMYTNNPLFSSFNGT
jgi:hypothetical protein